MVRAIVPLDLTTLHQNLGLDQSQFSNTVELLRPSCIYTAESPRVSSHPKYRVIMGNRPSIIPSYIAATLTEGVQEGNAAITPNIRADASRPSIETTTSPASKGVVMTAGAPLRVAHEPVSDRVRDSQRLPTAS